MPQDRFPISDDARYVYELFNDLVDARQSLDTDAYNNFAALYGHQWSEWSNIGRYYVNYMVLGRMDDRVRITANKIKPIMQARTTFIIGENPNITIDSDSPETDDKEAAYIAQRVARADWEQNNIYGKIQDCWEWVKSCGISFIKTYYDPSAGKLLGKLDGSGKPVFEGQVKSAVVPKFSLFWDPLAASWDEAQYCVIGTVVARERLEKMGLNINFDQLTGDAWATAPTQMGELIAQLERPEMITYKDQKNQRGQQRNALVLEYYERPSYTNPEGRYLMTIGGQVIKKDILEFGEIPIIPFIDSTVAGTINGQTPVTEMRPIQELLNKIVSLDYERSQVPDMIGVPVGWPKKFGGKSLVVAELRPGVNGAPMLVSAGQNRPDYLAKIQKYEEWLENLAGVSALASRAQPGYQMSGRMGYIVTDSNRALLSGIRYRFQRSVADLVRMRLRFMGKYYNDERLMSFINEYDKREVVRFTGKDIGSNWSVAVRFAESNNNPEARAARILQLFQNQVVVAELMKDPVAMRKALVGIDPEIGHEYFVSENDTDVARDENYEFSQGGAPAVMPWNNDAAHNIEHKRQLDSDTLRKWSPQAVELLKQHYFLHTIQTAQKMREQMMQQAMMQQMAQAQQGQQGNNTVPGQPGPEMQPGGPETPIQAIDQINEQKTAAAFPSTQGGTQEMPPLPMGSL